MASELYREPSARGSAAQSEIQQGMFEKLSGGLSFSGHERDLLAWNRRDGRFLPISGVSGLDSGTDGRAAVYADFDNDGDLDIFVRVANGGERDLLFRNDVGSERGFLRIELEGRESGRDAVGARVRVKAGDQELTRVVEGAAGFASQSDPRLLFGLNGESGVEWIEVRWPSGQVQRYPGAVAGASLRIVEGDAAFREIEEVRFQLPDPPGLEERRWERVQLVAGQPLPELAVTSLAGETGPLAERVPRGKPALVNFWATWCHSCEKELPELQALHEAGKLSIVGVSVDDPEAHAGIPEYLASKGVAFEIFTADPDAVADRIFAGDMAIPLSVFLDVEGRVIDVIPVRSRETRRRWAELTGGE